MLKRTKFILVFMSCVLLQGCLGTVIGTTVDAAIEVVKIPFKVGGAVVDVVTGDELSDESQSHKLGTTDSDEAARSMESEGI